LEVDSCPPPCRFTDNPNGKFGSATFVLLGEDLPIAVYCRGKLFGEGVHAGYAHAVQAAGHLVGVLVELAPCVEYGHDDLEGRPLFLLVHVGRDTPTIVLYAYRIVLMDIDDDLVAVACEGLVDGVVYHLPNQVMEPFGPNVAYVHRRPFPD